MTKSTIVAAASVMVWALLLVHPVVGAGGVGRHRRGTGARGAGGVSAPRPHDLSVED